MSTTVTVTFIGNATTLISTGDLTLLTDPNFLHQGQHAYLGYGLVSKRLQPPALTVDQLPKLDAIVLSHMHGDYWDRVAQRLPKVIPVHFDDYGVFASPLADFEREMARRGHSERLLRVTRGASVQLAR